MKNTFTKIAGILSLILVLSAIFSFDQANAQSRITKENQNSNFSKSAAPVKPVPGTFFTLAPNPAKDIVYANFWSGEPTEYTVSIYSMIGTVLRSKSGTCLVGTNSALIDMTGFAPGLYLIQVNNHNVVYTAKLILQ